jgi:hypothetical protein
LVQRDSDKGGEFEATSKGSSEALANDLQAALTALRDSPDDEGGALTGEELFQLSLKKYGFAHDMAIKQVRMELSTSGRW